MADVWFLTAQLASFWGEQRRDEDDEDDEADEDKKTISTNGE